MSLTWLEIKLIVNEDNAIYFRSEQENNSWINVSHDDIPHKHNIPA
jgi:hypothetical protein